MNHPPSGTITFLFTDIEGSARLWEQYPQAMQVALAYHDRLLRRAIETNGGYVFKTMGDAFCAAFATAPAALCAAIDVQEALFTGEWNEVGPLRVRIALHTGAVQSRDHDYFGPPLNRIARLLDAAHGGQTLLSAAIAGLLRDQLPEGIALRDMGEHRLKDMTEHIHQLVIPGLPDDFPRLKTLDVFPNNLPAPLTSFVGRDHEIGECKRLLATTRLLTVTGTGGTGKTRLSLQVAADLLEHYADGVWFIELAPITDPALLPQAVAATLSVTEKPGQSIVASLIEYLKPKQLLLVVDNCEHLIGAAARLIEELLRACPHLQALASSREALGVAGETAWRLPSLSLPDTRQPLPLNDIGAYEAVLLFVERAQAARPDFALSEENAATVARICQRLDGIPLALELAAARVRMLTVEQIAARLDDRFRLLTGGSRTALPRQQTLRALIDWSYDLLPEPERALLRRMSVFVGGCTLEAAESICSEALDGTIKAQSAVRSLQSSVLDTLGQLVNKSLLIADEQGVETRYRMLETIRYYARDRLLDAGEAEVGRGQHRDYFLQLAEEAAPKLEGSEQVTWFNRLEAEHDNLRAALHWSLEHGDNEQALRLAGALMLFWQVHSHFSEGNRWMKAALEMADTAPASLRAWVLFQAGFLLAQGSGNRDARLLFERSLELARELGDERTEAYALQGLGTVVPNVATARELLNESLAIATRLEDKRVIAFVYQILGVWAEYAEGDYVNAISLFEQALALRRQLGDKRGIARTLLSLGANAYYLNRFDKARQFYDESLTLFRELGSRSDVALVIGSLADTDLGQGDFASARALYEESLATFRELEDRRYIAYTLGALGEVARYQGEYATAKSLLEQSLTTATEVGHQDLVADALCKLGQLAYAQDDYAIAHQFFIQSLKLGVELDNRWGQTWLLSQFAALAMADGNSQQAAQLLGAGEALRENLSFLLTPVEQPAHEQLVTSVRAALDTTTFTDAWNAGRAMSLEAAVAIALAGE